MNPFSTTERKQRPVATGVIDYFPDAILELARVSWIGNEQHNPGTPLHWDRSKSTDEADALMRHFIERGTVDVDGVLHTAKVAWRALAMLQKELEAAGNPPTPPAAASYAYTHIYRNNGDEEAQVSPAASAVTHSWRNWKEKGAATTPPCPASSAAAPPAPHSPAHAPLLHIRSRLPLSATLPNNPRTGPIASTSDSDDLEPSYLRVELTSPSAVSRRVQ